MDDVTIFTMAKGATLDDLRAVEGKAELVNGELLRMTPASYRHGRITVNIVQSLYAFQQKTGRGRAFGDNIGFRVDLPHRQSFSPDAAYYLGPPTGDDFAEGAPVFAVEVRSKDDYEPAAESRLAAKRLDYFTAGTLVVWDVDARQDVVHAYRASAPNLPITYAHRDIARAEPALPVWSMPVDDIFRD